MTVQAYMTAMGQLEAVLFSSLARPGTVALWTTGPRTLLASDPPLRPPPGGRRLEEGTEDGRSWMRVCGSEGCVAAAASETGHGTNIIAGLALSMKATAAPVLIIATGILISFSLSGL